MTEDLKIPTTAQVDQWLEHDRQLINDGAAINHLGNFTITNEQYERLAADAPAQTLEDSTESGIVSVGEAKTMTPERLHKIISESVYIANPYIGGQGAVMYNGISGSINIPIFDDKHFSFPSREIEKPFTDAGVSELVTIAEGSKFHTKGRTFTSGKWLTQEYAGEPIYAVQYMTLTGTASGYEYREARNRYAEMSEEEATHLTDVHKEQWKITQEQRKNGIRGERISEFNYLMFLPESLAKELGEAMMAWPQLARELGDELVLNPDATQDWISNLTHRNWDRWKPPYAKWREANGGVDRMAFRTTSDQSVDEAKIVEY